MTEQLGKLRWRCRRGMKELDLLASSYLDQYYLTTSKEEQQAFANLMELQDPLLISYIFGGETLKDVTMARVIGVMRTLLLSTHLSSL